MNDDRRIEILERAESLANEGKFDAAIELCDQVLAATPDSAAALHLKGFCLAESNRTAEALPFFKLARLHLPTDAGIRFNLAKALDETGDAKGALAEYDESLRLDGGDVHARTLRAELRGRLGDEAGALADFDELVRRRPDDPRAYLMRGGWHLTRHRADLALPDLRKAVRLDPSLQADVDDLGRSLGYEQR